MTGRTMSGLADTIPDSVEGTRTRLRALRTADYGWLFETVSAIDSIARWRFRGAVPDPGNFPEVLWFGVHTQLVIESQQGEPMGLVTSYGADLRCGFTKVACIFDPGHQRRGWPFEGVVLFLDHLFTHWPLRKIYFEAPAPVADEVGLTSIEGDILRREACLTEHDLFEGSYVDLLVFALTRRRFDERVRPLSGISVGGRP
jgi:RimJ/RimL family protein N-acetyltransferase